jgi:hypothetical protein
MKRIIPLLLFISLAYSNAKAQALISDISGSPVSESKYVNVEGNPFLTEEWVKSDVKLANGTVYKDVAVRLDVVTDELLFKNTDGKILAFVDPVAEFTFISTNQHFINGISGLSGYTPKSYFQALNEGKAKILKKTNKTVVERKEYNSATTTKSFVENSAYFLLTSAGQIVPLKKDKKFILATLGDKSGPLETYINDKKLNLKKDADLTNLVDYYNTL